MKTASTLCAVMVLFASMTTAQALPHPSVGNGPRTCGAQPNAGGMGPGTLLAALSPASEPRNGPSCRPRPTAPGAILIA